MTQLNDAVNEATPGKEQDRLVKQQCGKEHNAPSGGRASGSGHF